MTHCWLNTGIPPAQELDEVSTEHPVVASHISGHMLVANSRALELAGIDASTPDPVGGVIGRMPGSQEPNGLLEETARLDIEEMLLDLSIGNIFTPGESGGTGLCVPRRNHRPGGRHGQIVVEREFPV